MKLTDTQSTVLAAAAARADGAVLPLPPHLRGGAIVKVCDALKAKGLTTAAGEGGEERLVISDAGRQALALPIQLPVIPKSEPASIEGEGRKRGGLNSARASSPAPSALKTAGRLRACWSA